MDDTEQLKSLQTERAFLVERGKLERASQVDDQIEAVQARIAAAHAAAAPDTTAVSAPPERATPPKARGSRGRKPANTES